MQKNAELKMRANYSIKQSLNLVEALQRVFKVLAFL